jgi:hypothetical protein
VLRATFAAIASVLFSFSCDDDEQAPPPEPPGPVAMMLGELRPRGSEVWHRDDPEPVVIGCDRQLGVTLYVYNDFVDENGRLIPDGGRFQPSAASDWKFTRGDYLLRPPGSCTRAQCGIAKVTVESETSGAVVTAHAAVETVVVDLTSLGELDGTLTIRAELLEHGRMLAMKNGQPLADELELSVSSEDCGPDGEAGAGGAPSGTGGSGNQAGEGGAGTGGSAGSSAGMGGVPGGGSGEGGGGGV